VWSVWASGRVFGVGRAKIGGEGGHYFLAGNTLAWPVIGLAMFAANYSTVHLVSLAEPLNKFGWSFGNSSGWRVSTLILLSLFFDRFTSGRE